MSKPWVRSLLRWIVTSACALTVGALLPARVEAQRLSLRAPAHCGTLATLQARVAQLAGKEAAARAEASIVISGPARGVYQLEATVATATRRSTHADCRVLFDAAVLIVVFSVNPALAQEPLPEAPQKANDSAPRRASDEPDAQHTPRRVSAHAELSLVQGVLPALAVPVSLGFRIAVARLGATYALRYAPPVESGTGPRARVQLLGSTLVGHYAPWPFMQLGAGLEADLLLGHGRAVQDARRDVTSRLAVRFELLLRQALRGRHHLALVGALGLAVHRPPFEVIDYGTVFQPNFVTFSGGLRWEVSIL